MSLVSFNLKEKTLMSSKVSMTQNVSSNEKKAHVLNYKDHKPNIFGMPVYDPNLVLGNELIDQMSEEAINNIFNDVLVIAMGESKMAIDVSKLVSGEHAEIKPELKDRIKKVMLNSMFNGFLKTYDDKEAKEMLEELQSRNYILSSKLRNDILKHEASLKEDIFSEAMMIMKEMQ